MFGMIQIPQGMIGGLDEEGQFHAAMMLAMTDPTTRKIYAGFYEQIAERARAEGHEDMRHDLTFAVQPVGVQPKFVTLYNDLRTRFHEDPDIFMSMMLLGVDDVDTRVDAQEMMTASTEKFFKSGFCIMFFDKKNNAMGLLSRPPAPQTDNCAHMGFYVHILQCSYGEDGDSPPESELYKEFDKQVKALNAEIDSEGFDGNAFVEAAHNEMSRSCEELARSSVPVNDPTVIDLFRVNEVTDDRVSIIGDEDDGMFSSVSTHTRH